MSVQKLIQLKREEFARQNTPLREPCLTVDKFDSELQNHVANLVDTFEAHEIAVGLAAPQIGIQLRICVINVQKGKPRPHFILINPVITSQGEANEEKFESCMSLPLFRGKVIRAKHVNVSFQDEHGTSKTLDADAFLARVIQHEIDHLNGILYIDKMVSLDALEPAENPKFSQ